MGGPWREEACGREEVGGWLVDAAGRGWVGLILETQLAPKQNVAAARLRNSNGGSHTNTATIEIMKCTRRESNPGHKHGGLV